MSIRHGVLNASRGGSQTLSSPKSALASLLLQPATAAQLAEAKQVTLTGDESVLATYGTLIDTFDTDFPIVSP
jgi:alkyl sulfatase BDS1-like metallo-beta-lactamase superfamily hydrolase